jgi:hypothetical protein
MLISVDDGKFSDHADYSASGESVSAENYSGIWRPAGVAVWLALQPRAQARRK